jgi:Big-like domain-containing protein/cadherin-like protein/parallel beta helix pectate lyase-like protein
MLSRLLFLSARRFAPNPFRRRILALSLVGLSTFPSVARATIIQVPANQPTPQAAVAAAANGDTILIAPGTYLGGLWIQNKALVIASWFLTTADTSYISQTVIDTVVSNACGGASGCAGDAVIEFGDNANGSKVVGLTVQRGKDGIRSHAQADISYCHCIRNEDGADYQVGGRGTFSNSLFAFSTDEGIDLNAGVDLTIIDNTITENSDDGIEFRLYPYVGPLLTVKIIGNRFIHNDSDGIQLIDSPDSSSRLIRIERNLFTTNRKATLGFMPDQQTDENFTGAPTLEKVQFINNTVVGDGYGVCGGANVVVVNNVIQDVVNKAFRKIVGPNAIAAHNLVWNCGAVNDSSNVDDATTLLVNPLLAADDHLTASSPAVNAGVASYVWRGEDVVALPPTGYSGSAPDLGAYEFNANAPVAHDDSYPAPNAAPLSVSAPGLLANDTDPNSDPLTVTPVISAPHHGSLTLGSDGSFLYTNSGDGAPRDSFVYEAKDPAGNTARATCLLLVQLPDDPPVAVTDVLVVDLDSTGNGLDVLANDHDSDPGDVVTLQSVNTAGTLGTAAIQGDLIDYTPPAGFTGNDSFTYTVHDILGATATATVVVVVSDVTTFTANVKVSAGADDAEESATGTMSLSSGDLELTWDGTTQKVGMRFPGMAIPKNAAIRKAYVQFKTDEVWSDVTNLIIRAQAADNPTTFTTAASNISSRPLGAMAAGWTPPLWSVIDEVGPNQRTPNLTRVISEVVNRSGWASGNAMAIIVTGTGHRVAKAFESDAAGAPVLHAEWVNGAVPIGVEGEPEVAFALHRVSPSPTHGPLRVDFSVARAERATIELLDVAGRRVVTRELIVSPGRHQVELREPLPAGLYVVRLRQGPSVRTAKAVVLR